MKKHYSPFWRAIAAIFFLPVFLQGQNLLTTNPDAEATPFVGSNKPCSSFSCAAINAGTWYSSSPYYMSLSATSPGNNSSSKAFSGEGFQEIDITSYGAGQTFAISGFTFRSCSASQSEIRAYFVEGAPNYSQIGATIIVGGHTGATPSWEPESANITKPTGAARLRIAVYAYSNCGTAMVDDLSVTAGAGCTITASATSTPDHNVGCNNVHDGSINLTVSGGTALFTYDWNHLPGSNDPEDLTDLAAGTYSVTVTDANNCTATTSATVAQTPPPSCSSISSVELITQEDVDEFASTYCGCPTIPGSLIIGDNNIVNDINDLSGLSFITSVGGFLRIDENDVLTNLDGLESITTIGGELTIDFNPNLENIDGLSGLTQTNGGITINNNQSLTNLDGLNSLQSFRDYLFITLNNSLLDISLTQANSTTPVPIHIFNNQNLNAISGLSNLTADIPYLRISDNSSLQIISGLNGSNHIGTAEIYNLPSLQGISGFNGLETAGEITIAGFPQLQTITGFNNLESVSFQLVVAQNPQITNLDWLSSLINVGSFIIQSCPLLNSINGLSSLQQVGHFSFYDSPNVTSLSPLSNLQQANGIEFINLGMADLTGLSGLNSVNFFNLYANQNLTSLNGLGIFTPNSINLANNPQLSQCDVETICNNLNAVSLIQGNLAPCNTVLQIAAECNDVDADGDGVTAGYDCNDNDPNIYPNATETCNATDDDCDGQVDEGIQQFTFYRDEDQDGYGDPLQPVQACTAPSGYVADNTDCNDADSSINPGATEVCNGNGDDEDCDGLIDEGVLFTYYLDADADGYGDPNFPTDDCSTSPPSGYAPNDDDCDDSNPSITTGDTWFADNDGDSYGNPDASTTSCSQPSGYVANNGDCNDNNAAINPAASETCNGTDDDCDGTTDDGLAFQDYYVDADGDGYGTGTAINACQPPTGSYATQNGDCNDNNAAINPASSEACGNSIDDDCDSQVDEGCSPCTTGGNGTDLIVLSAEAPATAQAGQQIEVEGVVKNTGNVKADANSKVRWYLSNDAVWDAGDYTESNWKKTIHKLDPGEEEDFEKNFHLPSSGWCGSKYLIFKADADGEVAESCEENNTFSLAIFICCGNTDLKVHDQSAPNNAVAGQPITMSARVKNHGTTAAPVNKLRFYLSGDNTFGNADDTPLGTVNVPALNGGQTSSNLAANVTLPNLPPGNYYCTLFYFADADMEACESNENNNLNSRYITITSSQQLVVPDLDLVAQYHPADPEKAELTWFVNAKVGSTHEIEHSSDGVNFQLVHTEPEVSGKRPMHRFSYTGMRVGVNFFRVRLTDPQGNVTYSNLAQLNLAGIQGLLVAPNPNSGVLRLAMPAWEGKAVEVLVSDGMGREVFRQSIGSMPEGTMTLDLRPLMLRDGLYQISLVHLGRAVSERVAIFR